MEEELPEQQTQAFQSSKSAVDIKMEPVEESIQEIKSAGRMSETFVEPTSELFLPSENNSGGDRSVSAPAISSNFLPDDPPQDPPQVNPDTPTEDPQVNPESSPDTPTKESFQALPEQPNAEVSEKASASLATPPLPLPKSSVASQSDTSPTALENPEAPLELPQEGVIDVETLEGARTTKSGCPDPPASAQYITTEAETDPMMFETDTNDGSFIEDPNDLRVQAAKGSLYTQTVNDCVCEPESNRWELVAGLVMDIIEKVGNKSVITLTRKVDFHVPEDK